MQMALMYWKASLAAAKVSPSSTLGACSSFCELDGSRNGSSTSTSENQNVALMRNHMFCPSFVQLPELASLLAGFCAFGIPQRRRIP
ncbi:hypothetical protein D9M70_617270 [compost metagenome]